MTEVVVRPSDLVELWTYPTRAGRHIPHSGQGRTVTPMTDARVESFLADVLALEGENPDAIREGVHVALGDCEEIFKAQEVNRRMKDKAAHACHALCRARIAEDMRRRKGTATAEHLTFVLSVIDGPRFAKGNSPGRSPA